MGPMVDLKSEQIKLMKNAIERIRNRFGEDVEYQEFMENNDEYPSNALADRIVGQGVIDQDLQREAVRYFLAQFKLKPDIIK